MANGVFNIAKGRINELVARVADNDPSNSALIVVALQATAADGTIEDFDDLASLLADGSVTEATFTNYARVVNTDSEISAPTVDDTGNEQFSDMPDIVYTDAGGAANNSLVKLVVCYDSDTTSGADSDIIPLTHHDVTITTDGSTVTIAIPSDGFFGAT